MFDFVLRPVRSVVRVMNEDALRPLEETEHETLDAVRALERATDSIEHHVEFITTLLDEMRTSGQREVEALADAQDEWAEHVTSQAGPIQVHESCTSWYLGANVPGKVRVYMPYAGGLNVYRDHCAEVTAGGYAGFALA